MTHALILGAGVSGMAVARLARSRGVTVTIYDRRPTVEPLAEGFGSAAGEWDPLLLRDADMVISSPGFSERSAPIVDVLEWGLPLISEIEYAWGQLQVPVIAITGTNGKTTVTEAASAMLRASGIDAPAVGNIGIPLSDYTDRPCDVLVVEVSSFQLRFTDRFRPVAAAITNVAADHLDWHGSEFGYRQAKSRIFANQTSDDLLVYDCDDRGAVELASAAPSRLFPVSGTRLPDDGGGVDGGRLQVMDVVIDLETLRARDPIHLSNLAIAVALARHLGADREAIARTAAEFSPGAHRRALVGEWGGVTWVNDSKATNPHAALASIRAFDSVILIAGGLAKGLDVTPLAAEANVKMLLGIGEAGPTLVEAAGDRGRLAGSLELAVEMATQIGEPGDTVLLAPGCASFDQFDSYRTRGERFAQLVGQRVGGVPA